MDLSIIIVNWNTRDLLARCLESVYETVRDLTFEVFVVDNASSDGSAEMVRARFPDVQLIENPENHGFAAANNQALALADGENLLLLNPDTVLTCGAVAELVKALGRVPEAGIAGAQLLNEDGSPQESVGAFPSLWAELPVLKRLRFRKRGSQALQGYQAVDWVSGACLMIKRSAYENTGPLDECFWLYTEEADWCQRAKERGWKAIFVPQARVYHHRRSASRQRFEATMQHYYQSRVRFVAKHGGAFDANALRLLLRLKARAWRARPRSSPLFLAYPQLSEAEIVAAYRLLSRALSAPLGRYLSYRW